jgi:hypothetical protein
MAEKKSDDTLWIIGFIALIALGLLNGLGLITFDSPLANSTSTPSYITKDSRGLTGTERAAEEAAIKAGESRWKGKISLSSGSGPYEIQPNQEYITISAFGLKSDEKVNITGWTLTNAKGTRAYPLNDRVTYYPSDRVSIPSGIRLLQTSGTNITSPIVLEQGGSAVIVTGSMPNTSRFKVSSFLLNSCSGYLETTPTYDFVPPLSTNSCPRPSKEIDLVTLDSSCRKFVENMQTCRTPEFSDWTIVNGSPQRDCVDGTCGLSSTCRATIKNAISYNACVAKHAGDANFYTKEWRIFLDQKWELWAKEFETISLYDNEGRLVHSVSW